MLVRCRHGPGWHQSSSGKWIRGKAWLHPVLRESRRSHTAPAVQAADYLLGGYSLWGPMISNLGRIGYDHNSMYVPPYVLFCQLRITAVRVCIHMTRRRMAPYDWRLSFAALEKRDRLATVVLHYTTRYRGNSWRRVVPP